MCQTQFQQQVFALLEIWRCFNESLPLPWARGVHARQAAPKCRASCDLRCGLAKFGSIKKRTTYEFLVRPAALGLSSRQGQQGRSKVYTLCSIGPEQ